jgi:hypothetical protein
MKQGGSKMAIMVHYKDDTVSFVPDRDLLELIHSNSIVAFRRGAEWISLAGADDLDIAPLLGKAHGARGLAASTADVWRRIIVAETA